MMTETMIDSNEGAFVVVPSTRPKQLSRHNRTLVNVFLALCTLSLIHTICQMPPQIYKSRSPTMTYHVEGDDEYRVFTWINSAAFNVFLLPSSNVFPLLAMSLVLFFFLRRNIPKLSHAKGSDSIGILKTVIINSFTSVVPSARAIGELVAIQFAALLWVAMNWICIFELFLRGGSILGVILSVGLSAVVSYYIVSRLCREIVQTEKDFHGDIEGGEWDDVEKD